MIKMQRDRPKGLSLVEVLVVVAILGILLGLTAAAVMRIRDASLRADCANHLRQIGTALHGYEAIHRRLPAGVVHPLLLPGVPRLHGQDKDPYPLMSWHSRILPYVEQEALWRQIHEAYQKDPYHIAAPPHDAKYVSISLYVCSADGPRTRKGNSAVPTAGVTSYLGVSGVNSHRSDGVFYMDSDTQFASITDGLSNTLLVGERPPSANAVYGRWHGDWGPWGHANSYLGVREVVFKGPRTIACSNDTSHFQSGRIDDFCSVFHFWSLHSGGANFLFADGSVRFMTYSSAALMPALATRSGGEPQSALD